MKQSKVILTAIALASLTAGCTDAEPSESVSRAQLPIIDGRPATDNELFATVGLFTVADGEPFCTGTLVAPNVVVTAAHCLFNDTGPIAPEEIDIVTSALDAYDGSAPTYEVATAVGHGGYDNAGEPGALGRDDDIAVLTLLNDVQDQEPVPVLSMDAFDNHLMMGTMVTLTGYGQRDEAAMDPNLFGLLYIAETPYQRRTDHEMLAGGTGVPDTCTGDSGGPVYLDIDSTKYLIAAVSRASEPGDPPCGRGGVYTLVAAYDDFLVEESDGDYPGAIAPASNPSGSASSANASAGSGASGTGSSGTGSSGSGSGNGENPADDGGCSATGGDQGRMQILVWLAALAFGARRRRSSRKS